MELVNFSRWVSLKWAATTTVVTGVVVLAAAAPVVGNDPVVNDIGRLGVPITAVDS